VRRRSLAAAAGIVADAVWGEPPISPHPVSAFGRLMRVAERNLHRDHRMAGVAHAGLGIGVGVGAGLALRSTAAATYLAVAGRALGGAATEVAGALSAGDLDGARRRLPALVGRDTSALGEKEMARAAVESVAENTVDAVVAPALWAAVLGAPGALGYRAANTLDAMVGHRNPRYLRYGWASARLDDVANFGAARLTAALVVAVRPWAAAAVWSAVRRDAPGHPSPNSGVAEAAFAASLGLRLGGENTYGDRVEVRPPLGAGRPPEVGDIGRAVELSRQVALALAGALTIHGLWW